MIPQYDQNESPETVAFYDTVTGQFLGTADLSPKSDGSGAATATWTGYAENWNGFPGGTPSYNLGVGGYSIIAVYSGDAKLHRQPVKRRRDERRRRADYDTTRWSAIIFVTASCTKAMMAFCKATSSGLDGAGYTLTVHSGRRL